MAPKPRCLDACRTLHWLVDSTQLQRMRKALLRWYDAHRRDLPWRRTRDPYAIWVSEIMLQQTRANAVVDHYQRFMRKFPTVVALALASEEEVLALWSGLGYYRRARLLHGAALVVVSEHEGRIPASVEALRRMPGVGAYTAAAVASIAFGVPVAAVDGNVERVLARVEGMAELRGASKWQKLAQSYLDAQRPGDYNQAMMELGATVCTPRSPVCTSCPIHAWCTTRGEHPVAERAQMRSVQVAHLVAIRGYDTHRDVLLHQRAADASIMPGMWELPQLPEAPENDDPLLIVRHAITTTNYYVQVFGTERVGIPDGISTANDNWRALDTLGDVALTGLARKILQRLGLMQLDMSLPCRNPGRDHLLGF